jgi:hypothetical protein
MLIPAIAILGCVLLAGLGLGALYMMVDRPPQRLGWRGALHGAGGMAGFAVLVLAMRAPAPTGHAAKMGAGAFGVVATALIGMALAAGLVIAVQHLRRGAIPLGLVATHGLLAVVGYTLLVTYLTMLH